MQKTAMGGFISDQSVRCMRLPAQMMRVMRLLTFFLFIACLSASASGSGQSVTISGKALTYKQVFAAIEEQTGYVVMYDQELFTAQKTFSLSVRNLSLSELLNMILKDQPLEYEIADKTIFISKKSQGASGNSFRFRIFDQPAPPVKILVIDSAGNPLSGATVVVKNTKRSGVTNNSGLLNVEVKEGDVLLISYVGYTTKSVLVTSDMIAGGSVTAALNPAHMQLEEVAVINTGYQKMRPNEVTGSVTVVDNTMLNQQTGMGIIERLDGVASGVMFPKQGLQDAPQFMIRGFSTINGPKNALIILDNFPYDGDMNNINPNDVESITVLKDAAAASIWGARAANGVVVITTKKGKKNQPLHITLNSNYRVTQKPDLLSLRTISSSDYIDVEKMLFDKGYYNSSLNNTRTFPALSPVVEILNQQRNGVITDAEAKTQIDAYRNIDTRKEYSDYVYQKGVAQQHALSLSGGSESMTYYLSAGYDHTEGNLKEVDDRFTFRSENQFYPFKSMQISLGTQYTINKNLSGQSGFGNVRTGAYSLPYTKFVDEAGNPLPVTKDYRQPFIDTAGGGLLLDWNYYPAEEYKQTRTKTNLTDLQANVGINYKLFEWLSVDIKYMYERQNVESNELLDILSYETRDLINRYSEIDRSTGIVHYAIPLGGILIRSTSALQTNNLRGQVNLNKSIQKNNFSAILGAETRQTTVDGYGNRSYGYDPNTLVTAEVDLVNAYPTFISGRSSRIPGGGQFTNTLNRYVSFYANAAYTYNTKYTLTVSGRRDASNLFGVNTNNKWNPLWSAGAGWLISNESFYHVSWLSHLKFRATYGYTGNTDPSRTAVLTIMAGYPSDESNLLKSRIGQFPNPELRWERLRTINYGVDFAAFNSNISGNLEFYQKQGTDLFGATVVDPTAGLNGIDVLTRNVANMKGNGVDLTLNARLLDHSFKWNSTLLFNYAISRVTKYYRVPGVLSGGYISTGQVITPLEGKDLYGIAVLRYAGLDENGNPRGFWEKQVSTDYTNIVNNTPLEDLVYKPSIPKFFGSFINTFIWRGFSLSANISYRLGYYFVKPSIYYSSLFANGASVGTEDYAKRWRQPGDERKTNVPSLVYPASSERESMYGLSNALVFNASNIKLQYVNLSYVVNTRRLKNRFIQSGELYINASNLGILWKANKEGIDPDYISTPVLRKTFTIGLRAKF